MILALISDIHANLEALQAVLKDIDNQQSDKIICLGDVIGYGPNPAECLQLVNERCEVKLMGNHEYVVLGLLPLEHMNPNAESALTWTREQLIDRDLNIINDFEMDHLLDDVYFVHASPYQPDEWNYVLTRREAQQAFDNFDQKICFLGHSHVPEIYILTPENNIRQQAGHSFLPDRDNRYIINVGSVGQPRDNDPQASYVLFDTEAWEVTYRRVAYDIASAQNKMRKAGIPRMLIERLTVGR